MINRNYIYQMQQGTQKPVYPAATGLDKKTTLEKFLKLSGLNIKLLNMLKGGVDSQVYQADLDGQKVVVKHTEDRGESVFQPPFSPIDFFVSKDNHNLDAKVLKLLRESNARVPKILFHFPEMCVTVMEDMSQAGFELMSSVISERMLDIKSASKLSLALINLHRFATHWEQFECYKTPEAQIFERGIELRLAYPNTQELYLELQKAFLSSERNWIWPDSHPKNIFINSDGDVAFIDFGGSFWGDQHFVMANFIGHFIVVVRANKIANQFIADYIREFCNTYMEEMQFDEGLFCKYVAMEILHRSNGKWIDCDIQGDDKINNLRLGLAIIDNKLFSVDKLLELLLSH